MNMKNIDLRVQESDIRNIFRRLIEFWNERDAEGYASLFNTDGNVVGFDGSQVNGREAIRDHLSGIFADHETAAYVCIIREVRLLEDSTALLRAVVGMVPPGQKDINPAANAVQSLVAVKRGGQWKIELFHNTPAQFHGQPEHAQMLTDELRNLL